MSLSKVLGGGDLLALIWRVIFGLQLFSCPAVFRPGAQNTGGESEGLLGTPTAAKCRTAVILASNMATARSLQATSDSEGAFRLTNLPFGKYRVEVSLSGFAKKTIYNVTVEPVNAVKLTIALSPQGVSEIVNITSEGQLLQTENSTQAATLSQKELVNIPTSSRNITHLIVTEPGVSAPLPDRTGSGLNITTTPGTQDQDSAQSLNPSVNGARPTNNSLRMNGIDGTNLLNRSGGLGNNLITPLDALEVVSVQSALYNSPTGRNGGANIEVVTRTGTNEFHGSASHFLQNEKFNANEFFLNRNGNERPKFRRNESAVTFGGPVIKDKFFFFAAIQRTDF